MPAGGQGCDGHPPAEGFQADWGWRYVISMGFRELAGGFTSAIARSGPPAPD